MKTSAPKNDGWTVVGVDENGEANQWMGWDPSTEGGIIFYGGLPDYGAPGFDDPVDDPFAEMDAAAAQRDADLNAQIEADQIAAAIAKVAAGGTVQIVNADGEVVGHISLQSPPAEPAQPAVATDADATVALGSSTGAVTTTAASGGSTVATRANPTPPTATANPTPTVAPTTTTAPASSDLATASVIVSAPSAITLTPAAQLAAPNSGAGGESLAWGVTKAALGGAGSYAKGLLWTGPKGLVTGLYNTVAHPINTATGVYNFGKAVVNDPLGVGKGIAVGLGNTLSNPEGIGTAVFGVVSTLAPGAIASRTGSFFEGTSYTAKVLRQMEGGVGEFHSFPESVTAFESAGSIRTITGGDGLVRQVLEIPGSYSGRDGVFQFIKNSDGTINHRLFVPGDGL